MKVSSLRMAIIAVCVFAAAVPAAYAQNFPNKPITLICPWPPGGSTDQHLREIGRAHV